MTASDVFLDSFARIRGIVHRVTEGASAELLAYRVDPETNSIAWLIWHLTRIQDAQVSDVADTDERWIADGWFERFALPLPPESTGYGHNAAESGSVIVPAELLLDYHDAVYEATVGFLETLDERALNRVVDTSWDPPVTVGVRLVSTVADDLQHAGQAGFVQGIARRAGVR